MHISVFSPVYCKQSKSYQHLFKLVHHLKTLACVGLINHQYNVNFYLNKQMCLPVWLKLSDHLHYITMRLQGTEPYNFPFTSKYRFPHHSSFFAWFCSLCKQQGGLSMFCTISISLLLVLCININPAAKDFVHLGITAHCIPQMHIRDSSAFNKWVGSSFGNFQLHLNILMHCNYIKPSCFRASLLKLHLNAASWLAIKLTQVRSICHFNKNKEE